jgi:imidazole glycerol phosphate synthase subunit HisF
VFVPLTVGGGIRGFKDANGTTYSALDVASSYFRCADSHASPAKSGPSVGQVICINAISLTVGIVACLRWWWQRRLGASHLAA